MAALKALPELIALIALFKRSADARVERGIGFDQAVKESLVKGTELLRLANAAEEQARRDHANNPTSDDAFDKEFMRKD